jgi:dihydrodipicolinate synthase/N-acetylneuraminate lyase
MRKVNWVGVYPAVTTKFFENGDLDISNFCRHLQFQVSCGVKGVIVGGSLGESSTITHAERLQLTEAALATIGKEADVIMNIAEGSTRSAVELAKKAKEIGVHGLMVLPPMLYKPTEQEVADFYIEVAEATDLPILMYNNPIDYKIEITFDNFDQFVDYPTLQAVKESTRDISNVTRMKNRYGDRFKVLCGVDTLAVEELLMGADGWVAGLVDAFPLETVTIFDLVKAGKIDEALTIYRWFLPLLELDINPQLVQNIKLAEEMTGVGTEFVRLPRQILKGEERERVIKIIDDALKIRPKL